MILRIIKHLQLDKIRPRLRRNNLIHEYNSTEYIIKVLRILLPVTTSIHTVDGAACLFERHALEVIVVVAIVHRALEQFQWNDRCHQNEKEVDEKDTQEVS